MLPGFSYLTPKSTSEALSLLISLGDRARIIAGGTDLLVQMKQKKYRPEYLISLSGIEELAGIKEENGGLVIGALTTHRQLEMSPLIRRDYPILTDALIKLGSVQVRNLATIGGNLCNGAPSADTAPPLLALNARLLLAGPGGRREVPLDQFYTGPGKTVIRPDEILTGIIIPGAEKPAAGCYLKLARRRAMDLATLGVAVFLQVSPDGKTCLKSRIALGTAAPTPLRARKAEGMMEGAAISDDLFRAAGEAAAAEASPRTSMRGTAEYRLLMIGVLVRRAAAVARQRISMAAV